MKTTKINRLETGYPGVGEGRGGAVAEEAVDVVVGIRAEAWSTTMMKKKAKERQLTLITRT
jgi:hypothetical protein